MKAGRTSGAEGGKSAYEIWLDNGHTGTEADFLNWLKNENGTDLLTYVGIGIGALALLVACIALLMPRKKAAKR